MAIIKCKMCGGDMELSADQTFGTCEYCGSTMTLPKVDDDQRAAAFNRGNHFRRLGEFDKALAVYERLVQEDEGDAEAHWCCALCRFGIEYVQDPASGAYLPTCHRASFDSFLEDVDYKAALEHADPIARRQYQADGEKIAQVQRGILSTVQKEAPFDVFICYKESDEQGRRTVDSTLAQEIYYQLTEQGRRVFFARITLEDKAGQEYEPYIFAALHSAKVMVVVGTKPEYLNAVWVKNEWSRYLALLKADRKRLLLPCYRDMDPYDLPEQLSVLQSYDMGKIGFIQDLIRGINKVLDADKKPVVKETVVVQGEGGSNLAALLKRGNMALEDGEWEKADGFFEQALNIDAECAEAYLGKALAGRECANLPELVTAERADPQPPKGTTLELYPEDEEWYKAACEKYLAPPFIQEDTIYGVYKEIDRTYTVLAPEREWALAKEKSALAGDKLLSRALRYADAGLKGQLEDAQAEILRAYEDRLARAREKDEAAKKQAAARYAKKLEEAENRLQKLYEDARKTQSEAYEKALKAQEDAFAKETQEPELLRANADVLDAICGMYKAIGSYKDCAQRADDCKAEAARQRKEADAEEECRKQQAKKQAEEEAARKRLQEEQAAKKRSKRNKIIAAVVFVACIAAGVIFAVTQSAQRKADYQAAAALAEAGSYDEAYAAFTALGTYEDSQARAQECLEAYSAPYISTLAAPGYSWVGKIDTDTWNKDKYDYEWTFQEDGTGSEHEVHRWGKQGIPYKTEETTEFTYTLGFKEGVPYLFVTEEGYSYASEYELVLNEDGELTGFYGGQPAQGERPLYLPRNTSEEQYQKAVALLKDPMTGKDATESKELLDELEDYKDAAELASKFLWMQIGEKEDGETTNYLFDSHGTKISSDMEVTLTYNPDGTIATRRNGDQLFTYTYDEDGRLLSYTIDDGRVCTYTYDEDGRRLSYAIDDGTVCTYTYNEDGQEIQRVYVDGDGIHQIVTTLEYDGNGQLIQETVIVTDEEGEFKNVYTYTYNDDGTIHSRKLQDFDIETVYLYGWVYAPDAVQ